MLSGSFEEGVSAARRRLTISDLPALESGDAISMVALCLFSLSRYEESISVIEQAISELRPGQPVIHLAQGITRAIVSAYTIGQWTRTENLASWLHAALNQTSLSSISSSLCHSTIEGFFYLFRIALAREQFTVAQELSAILENIGKHDLPNYVVMLSLAQGLLRDELCTLKTDDFVDCRPLDALSLLIVLSEFNIPVSAYFIASARKARHITKAHLLMIEMAESLANEDYTAMARLIDELISCNCIVHATRMRLVLAQRTGDLVQLALARPILERLGDKQFLCKLQEIESLLLSESPMRSC